MKGPLAVYRERVHSGHIRPDPAQEFAIRRLQTLEDELRAYGRTRQNRLLSWLGRPAPQAPKGLYLWGEVGRGKSMLMDLFYETVPVARKRRVHFLQFMLETHEAIFNWRQANKRGEIARSEKSNGDDPIVPVARNIADKVQLLCFDEFQVSDVADAMILGRLFTALFDFGVVVVLTSNRAPDTLYEGGLNRQLFLPFIELLKQRLLITHLESPTDYRLERLSGHPVYHTPLGPESDREMDAAWLRLTDTVRGKPMKLEVQGRKLLAPQTASGAARFTFRDLCEAALGGPDYLQIAWTFHTVLLDHIPRMDRSQRNEAKRFVTLIDALYDNRVKLICSADGPPASLYPEGDGSFEFARTVSRLMEMQSVEYLAMGHAV
ncbi:MAG TPA: cell division protein ZapE [Alphaproteobacteria bacterium]|jgi:cell division protein ZapE|nr:cell division protein ZapE [Alphaproteobacteria bacterium]